MTFRRFTRAPKRLSLCPQIRILQFDATELLGLVDKLDDVLHW